MIRSTRYAMPLLLLVATAAAARGADAQSIAQRVSRVREGKVRMIVAARPEVCGYGNSISRGGSSRMNWSPDNSPDVVYDEGCSHSPVRLVLTVDDGRITKLRTYVGGSWRAATTGVTDLGAVSTRDATEYLLGLASREEGSIGRDAIMPVTLIDSVTVWRQLIRIARDESRPRQTRSQALFWIGQAAGDKIAPESARLASRKGDDDEEVKKSAVFALSQRRNGEAVPALVQVARTNRDPEVRKAALFWLGQSGDPRAVSLFEEILSAR